jgi:hypothetical protein
MNYHTRVTRLTISPPGEPIFSDQTFHIEIEDEAARLTISPPGEPIFSDQTMHIEIEDEGGGEYVKISQQSEYRPAASQEVCINPDEWPAVKDAVESLLMTIAEWNATTKTK